MEQSKVFDVFRECVEAMRQGVLIRRISRTDKEFHFQNWFKDRLMALETHFDQGGRNSYPDFKLVEYTEGYEVKGLAWPGRESTYDCNSQVPTGYHNGRNIYYIFGRYPSSREEQKEYPVLDLVICHGDFLNANHTYVHKNTSIRGFGSYGDIMIRDRKMYVAPTPFALVDGLTAMRTLIVPASFCIPDDLIQVGELVRQEAERLVVGYKFDLVTNQIEAKTIPNPSAGKEHFFSAYRLRTDPAKPVSMNP